MSFVLLWLAVGVLGGLGAIARFLLDALVSASTGARFPLGTLVVNLSGALVLGVLVGRRSQRRCLPAGWHRGDRLLHDLLHMDARVPSPRRGRAALAARGERRAEPHAGRRRGCALGRLLGGG